jgi:putative nucleotidyltransferase with HDIG domain
MNCKLEVPSRIPYVPASVLDRESWLLRRVTLEQHPLRELLRRSREDATACAVRGRSVLSATTNERRAYFEHTHAPVQLDDGELARRIHQLPSLPRALTEALRVVRDDALSAEHCVRAIEQDVTLAARVLRLANSPFYGACGRVSSVCDAVRLLGLRTVASVVVAVSMDGVLAKWSDDEDLFLVYWRHAVATAAAARELARGAGADPDEAFLAGLLHDLGRLVLTVFAPGSAHMLRAWAVEEDVDSRNVEVRLTGRAHDEVGAAVARRWSLPEPIVAAIALHHAPSEAFEPGTSLLTAVVHVADAIAHAMDLAGDPAEAVPPIDSCAWRLVGLTEDAMPRIVERIAAGVSSIASYR